MPQDVVFLASHFIHQCRFPPDHHPKTPSLGKAARQGERVDGEVNGMVPQDPCGAETLNAFFVCILFLIGQIFCLMSAIFVSPF